MGGEREEGEAGMVSEQERMVRKMEAGREGRELEVNHCKICHTGPLM